MERSEIRGTRNADRAPDFAALHPGYQLTIVATSHPTENPGRMGPRLRGDDEEWHMVALRGRDIDVFLKAPDPARPVILLYGPDAGLVRERADALMASAVDDPADPFSLVRLDGDELAAEPSRLVEEAMTIPMFGGRRAIRVRAGSRSFASAIDTLADSPLKDCRIVIEAGELRPESPLRKACERAKAAVAIGCYPDDASQLGRLIDTELKVSNLR